MPTTALCLWFEPCPDLNFAGQFHSCPSLCPALAYISYPVQSPIWLRLVNFHPVKLLIGDRNRSTLFGECFVPCRNSNSSDPISNLIQHYTKCMTVSYPCHDVALPRTSLSIYSFLEYALCSHRWIDLTRGLLKYGTLCESVLSWSPYYCTISMHQRCEVGITHPSIKSQGKCF